MAIDIICGEIPAQFTKASMYSVQSPSFGNSFRETSMKLPLVLTTIPGR